MTASPPAKGVDLDVEGLLALRHLAARLASPPGGKSRAPAPGGVPFPRRGRGLDLHDIRPWSEGDDIRHLDRNATARTGLPHARGFREERERAALLVADFRPSMLFGTRRALRSVAGAEALTLLGWRIAGEGGRLGFLPAAGAAISPARGGRGVRGMIAVVGQMAAAHRAALEDADGAGSAPEGPLDAVLDEADRLAAPGTAIVLATGLDTPGGNFDATAERIARKRALVILLITDPFERAPPPGDYPYTAPGSAHGGVARGWFRVAAHRPPLLAADARVAALNRLGMRAAALGAERPPADMLSILERLGV